MVEFLSKTNEREALTWDRFVREIDDLHPSEWIFRGQSRNWDLATTLERHVPPGTAQSTAEQRMLYEFRRRTHLYLQLHQFPQTTGESLALMQHFGAPTRLVDFTKSPFVAAYFAAEDPGTDHRVIWAVNGRRLQVLTGSVHLSAGVIHAQDVERQRREPGFEGYGITDIAGAMAGQILQDAWLSTRLATVVVYEPVRLSERLSVQQGLFLVPRDLTVGFMENLKGAINLDDSDVVRRLVLRGDQRGRALEQLRLMNITRGSLFPGLDGFAQSFRQLLVNEPVEARLARVKNWRDLMELVRDEVPSGLSMAQRKTPE